MKQMRSRFRLHSLFPQDGHTGVHVGTLNVRHQAPLEAAAQPFLKPLDILRRFIAGQDNLLVVIMQFVEGVEKLLLGTVILTAHRITGSLIARIVSSFSPSLK